MRHSVTSICLAHSCPGDTLGLHVSGIPLKHLGYIGIGLAALAFAGCALLPDASVTPSPVAAARGAPAAIAVYATKSDGSPLGDALVYVRPAEAAPAASSPPVVLDILARHFEPEVLPVRAGSTVMVENHDDVIHDVYSFSDAGPFAVHLAVGASQTLPAFAHTGVVVVGCKVHSDMLGYIYVTDAPYFGKTDSKGYLRLAGLPPGRYSLGVWRAGDSAKDLPGYPRTVTLTADSEQVVRVRL